MGPLEPCGDCTGTEARTQAPAVLGRPGIREGAPSDGLLSPASAIPTLAVATSVLPAAIAGSRLRLGCGWCRAWPQLQRKGANIALVQMPLGTAASSTPPSASRRWGSAS